MKRINRDPKRYEYVEQEEFCCVGATLEMVLRRHGIREFSQEDICCELGLYILPGYSSIDCAVPIPESVGKIFMGTPEHLISGGLNVFFLRHNLPFVEFFIPASRTPNTEVLKDTLTSLFRPDHDLIVVYKVEWKGEEFVHVGAIDEVKNNGVVLVDTDGLEDGWKLVEMGFEELLERMRAASGGGIRVMRRIVKR